MAVPAIHVFFLHTTPKAWMHRKSGLPDFHSNYLAQVG